MMGNHTPPRFRSPTPVELLADMGSMAESNRSASLALAASASACRRRGHGRSIRSRPLVEHSPASTRTDVFFARQDRRAGQAKSRQHSTVVSYRRAHHCIPATAILRSMRLSLGLNRWSRCAWTPATWVDAESALCARDRGARSASFAVFRDLAPLGGYCALRCHPGAVPATGGRRSGRCAGVTAGAQMPAIGGLLARFSAKNDHFQRLMACT